MRFLLNERARAFEEGKGGAGDEDEDRGEERPEERLFAVAVRVGFVRLGAREVNAEKKEYLVHGVSDGMTGLGEHRRAARKRAGDQFAAGDRQVRRHRGEDRAAALLARAFGSARDLCGDFTHGGK